MSLLELQSVDVRYAGRPVLRDVSLALGQGEVVGLVGPNGAGKSTLLRVAAGALPPSHGQALLEGASMRTLDRGHIARRIAWLPQTESTDLAYTAREIVAMGRLPHLGAFGVERDTDREIVGRALDAASARALEDRVFPSLSEGEKQRVLLARCLAQEPRVLLLDEPTSALDVRHAWSLMRAVRERATQGVAVLAAIHDLALAARTCDRVVVLADGAVVRSGSPEDALHPEVIAATFGMRARTSREAEGLVLTILGPASS